MKIFAKLMSIILTVLIFLTYSFSAIAIESEMNVDQKASLTVNFGKDEEVFKDTAVKIYKIADITDTMSFIRYGEFKNYDVEINNKTNEEWDNLARTLSGYISLDKINETQSQLTNKDGKVAFENLDLGLYLVKIDEYRNENSVFLSNSFIVSLPTLDQNGSLKYDVNASPKILGYNSNDHYGSTYKKVIKVWDDENDDENRPIEVSISLLCDGEVYDTVKLNEKNNWRYVWYNLDNSSNWEFIENDVPEGYVVSISNEGYVYIITNSLKETTTQPTTQTTTHTTTQQPTTEKEEEIPKTGVNWAPIPVIACVGLMMIIAGVFIGKKQNGEVDE